MDESYQPSTEDISAILRFLTNHSLPIPPRRVLVHAWLCGKSSTSSLISVNTRCVYYYHEPLPAHHKNNMTLAPLVDMINHSPSENVFVSREQDEMVIRALRTIEENEEIAFSYHSASGRFWVCEYGFWLEDNSSDDLDLTTELDPMLDRQKEWLQNEGYWGYNACPTRLTKGLYYLQRRGNIVSNSGCTAINTGTQHRCVRGLRGRKERRKGPSDSGR